MYEETNGKFISHIINGIFSEVSRNHMENIAAFRYNRKYRAEINQVL